MGKFVLMVNIGGEGGVAYRWSLSHVHGTFRFISHIGTYFIFLFPFWNWFFINLFLFPNLNLDIN